MKALLQSLVFVVVLGTLAYVFQSQLPTAWSQVSHTVLPCTQPLTYKIGLIDPRFGLSTSTVLADIAEASQVWDSASGKQLFAYDQAHGAVTINFTYDTRQRTIADLKNLGITVSTNQSSYDALKAKYDAADAEYRSQKSSFESALASFNTKNAAYQSEVSAWNAKGGAPPDVYARLQNEQAVLVSAQSQLQSQQDMLNAQAANINAFAATLNNLITELNLSVSKYNTVGSSLGSTFEEGLYTSSLGTQEIDIYEYANHLKLVRVLAHELGHSLGLGHVTDANAIMYPLNQGTALQATPADVKELDAACHVGS